MSQKLQHPPVAKPKTAWTEKQLEATLAKDYGWTRAMIADLFRTLRKRT